MRRFYQESWQGIPFSAFAHLSFFHLAEPKFYGTFYEELFRRYKDWEDLPASWRENKKLDAAWLARLLEERRRAEGWPPERPLRVLSIGSGVGYMEHALLQQVPGLELHVNEPSTVGMRWLRTIVPADRIYIGVPPACLPSDIKYDMIYLSAVDYSMLQRDLERLLGELRSQLSPGGEVICLSASLLEEDSFVGSLVNFLKNIIRCGLHFLGVRRQQFWGWRRTRAEYKALFREAGFGHIRDGWLDDNVETYWIRGV